MISKEIPSVTCTSLCSYSTNKKSKFETVSTNEAGYRAPHVWRSNETMTLGPSNRATHVFTRPIN